MTLKAHLLIGVPSLIGVMALVPVCATAQQASPPAATAHTQSAADRQAIKADHRQGQYFNYQGNRIFYQMKGQGEPLVLIPGYPLSGELFEHQLQGLSSHFNVITLDLPGYGKSHAANDQGSIMGYAHDVVALLDHIGVKKAIIGGHSMGGVITMELYKEAPERFAGMLLIDTNAKAASIVGKSEWDAFAKQARVKGVDSTVPLLISKMLTGKTIMEKPKEADQLKNVIREASVDAFVAGGHALADRMNYVPSLGNIKVPTLVIVGEDDPLWPFPLAEMMHNAIPGSKLAILPGAAHASIFEKPKEANQAIMKWAQDEHLIPTASAASSGANSKVGSPQSSPRPGG